MNQKILRRKNRIGNKMTSKLDLFLTKKKTDKYSLWQQ